MFNIEYGSFGSADGVLERLERGGAEVEREALEISSFRPFLRDSRTC